MTQPALTKDQEAKLRNLIAAKNEADYKFWEVQRTARNAAKELNDFLRSLSQHPKQGA